MVSVIDPAVGNHGRFNLIVVMEYRVTDECLPIFHMQRHYEKNPKVDISG